MNDLIIGGVGVSLAIVAIVQALKQAFLPGKWAFLVSIALGIAAGISVSASEDLNLLEGIILGIMSGASASGFYSGGKTMLQEDRSDWTLTPVGDNSPVNQTTPDDSSNPSQE